MSQKNHYDDNVWPKALEREFFGYVNRCIKSKQKLHLDCEKFKKVKSHQACYDLYIHYLRTDELEEGVINHNDLLHYHRHTALSNKYNGSRWRPKKFIEYKNYIHFINSQGKPLLHENLAKSFGKSGRVCYYAYMFLLAEGHVSKVSNHQQLTAEYTFKPEVPLNEEQIAFMELLEDL
jgi:hypothetical protein